MTTQTTLFPKTELDEATAVLAHLVTEEEKADKASDAADQKVADTASRARKQRHVVARLQAMMPAAEPAADAEATEGDIEDAEVLQIEGDVLDPITGEVVGKEALAEGLEPVAEEMLADLADEGIITEPNVADVGKRCPDCMGEGRLPDKTGGGHHRCKKCEGTGSLQLSHPEPNISVVIVLYPGSDEPVVTKIGDRTRYSELVADYFTAAGLNGKHDAKDWAVVAEDELTTTGGLRKLSDVIAGADYGKRLLVVAADQGSVTGVAACPAGSHVREARE